MDTLNLENVLVLDPKVNVEETFKPKEVIHKSGVNKSRFVIPSDAYSNSNFLWQNVVPPSSTTIVERTLRIKYTITVTVTNPDPKPNYPGSVIFPYLDGNGVLQQGTCTAVLRDFPLQQACSGIDLKINGNSCSITPNDYITVFPHLLSDDEQNLYCNEFPSQKDTSALYARNDQTISNRSPFALYGQNSTAPSRASYVASSAVIAGAAPWIDVYTFNVVETLIISPMTWGSGVDNGIGLSNIQNITLNVKFDNLSRMVSVMSTALGANLVASTVSVALNQVKPELLMEYITQDPQMEIRQPLELVYPYEIVQAYRTPITNPATFANGAASAATIPGNTIKLGSIPDRLMIFCAPSKSSLSGSGPLSQVMAGTFLRITNLSLNFNNRVSLFNSYSENDLYKMSVANGLKDTIFEWKYGCGSLLIVDITKDVQLPADQLAGQSSTYMTIQPTVSISNSPLQYAQQATPIQYDLICVPIISGKAVISKQSMQLLLTAPDGQEVLATVADASSKVDANALANVDGKGYGGSLFGSTAKRLLHSGLDYLQKNPEHVAKAVGAVKGMLGGDFAGAGLKKKHSSTKSKRVY